MKHTERKNNIDYLQNTLAPSVGVQKVPPTRNDPVVAEDDEDTFRPHLQYRRTKDPGGWVLKSGYLKDNDPITDT